MGGFVCHKSQYDAHDYGAVSKNGAGCGEMRILLERIRLALRLALGDAGFWLGEIQGDGRVVGVRIPLDHAPSSHFNHGYYGDKRWRYVETADTVFWWGFSDLLETEKQAVVKWLAERGIGVRGHIGNTQQIRVGGKTMLGMTFSHGSGPRSRWRQRVDVLEN